METRERELDRLLLDLQMLRQLVDLALEKYDELLFLACTNLIHQRKDRVAELERVLASSCGRSPEGSASQ